MAIFEEIKVSWKGTEVVVPPAGRMRLIAKLEDIVTIASLSRCVMTGERPLAKLSIALGTVLRHVGLGVTDDEVYNEMFRDEAMAKNAMATIWTLLTLMFPPEHLRDMEAKAAKKPPAGETASNPAG